MSRNLVLYAGIIAWAGVIVDTLFHLAIGDPVVPAVLGMVILGWIALRAPHLAVRKATANGARA